MESLLDFRQEIVALAVESVSDPTTVAGWPDLAQRLAALIPDDQLLQAVRRNWTYGTDSKWYKKERTPRSLES